ncbi:hypothetical protein [Rhodococcus rhodochrous]|uniref:hypothetical protein n=1 Tax=Rhodococcus rhodochrous TaxID=1829 RepID=UPI0012FD1EAB|nr:hypothetical protein [Rhodococcus rhodochrous]
MEDNTSVTGDTKSSDSGPVETSSDPPADGEGVQEQEEAGSGSSGGSADTSDTETTQEETDWSQVAELIAAAIDKKQPTSEIISTDYGDFRVVHSVTTGELLVSTFLGAAIALFLVRWFFKAVWGR